MTSLDDPSIGLVHMNAWKTNGAGITRRSSLALGLGLTLTGVSARASGNTGWAVVDAAARRFLAEAPAPSVSISVMKRGSFAYSAAFGFSNLETSTRATPQSVYKIGSITKQFTAAALLALAQEGRLSVDDTLAKYFPAFPRASEITLEDMLSHTSGLGDYTETRPESIFLQQARIDYDAEALYQLMLQTNPLYVAEPGTFWSYSNTAYVLLGLIIERVTGESHGAYLSRRLLRPAGLSDTGVDDAADVVNARAGGYTPHAGGGKQFDNASFISMTVPGGAGDLRSTTEDLCRWHRALFGGRVIGAASLARMTAPHRLKSGVLPRSMAVAGNATEPETVEYSFGLETKMIENRRAVGHDGGINGFASILETFPEEKITFAVLINCDGGKALRTEWERLRARIVHAVFATV